MRRSKVLIGTLLLFALSLLGCGKISLGSSVAPPVTQLEDWRYRAQPWQYDGAGDYRATSRMTAEQAALYEELTAELSAVLSRNRRTGAFDFSQSWPALDAARIAALSPRYDPGTQLLEWRYENLGDYNLDGMVLTTDLKPVALAALGPQPLELDRNARLDWLDREKNGMLGLENAADVGHSYGRVVSGYYVYTGPSAEVASMAVVGLVRLSDALPGWPPTFQLHLPSGYGYACIQPVAETRLRNVVTTQPLCNYVLELGSGAPAVQVFDAVAPGT